MEFKTFKVRASGASKIIGLIGGITQKQLEELERLESKDKITDKQSETLIDLKKKRDTPPQLSQTAKSYCEQWLKEQIYGRRKEFSNKYTQKGWIVEDNSIDDIARYLDLGMLMKNELFLEDDFKHGTPDVKLKTLIIDAKNSWDCFTFPLFEDKIPNDDYYWQAQTYMDLADVDSFKLVYVLSNTPPHLIQREANYWAKENGYGDVDTELLQEFINKHTYDNIDDKYKFKVYDIQRNREDAKRIDDAVVECRKYIETLIAKL